MGAGHAFIRVGVFQNKNNLLMRNLLNNLVAVLTWGEWRGCVQCLLFRRV
jgi:hypothetical protein